MTFLLTVFSDLVIAVNVGVLLATVQFLRRMSSSVDVRQQGANGEAADEPGAGSLPEGVLVYAVEGPLFFAAVETFEQTLAATHTDPRTLIVRLNRVPFVDISGLLTILEVIEHLQGRGVRVILCEANERVCLKLDRAGVFDRLGWDNYAGSLSEAIGRVSHETKEIS